MTKACDDAHLIPLNLAMERTNHRSISRLPRTELMQLRHSEVYVQILGVRRPW